MVYPFNGSKEEFREASRALVARVVELTNESETGIPSLIWENRAFHGARVLFEKKGMKLLEGIEAQIFLALVIAAFEQAGGRLVMNSDWAPELDFPKFSPADVEFLFRQDPDSESTHRD